MKRFIIILSFLVLPFLSNAQDFVDDLFKKYSGTEGFTSIVISKDLLDFAFTAGDDLDKVKGKISDLKILVSNKHHYAGSTNFLNDIKVDFSKNSYLSMMEIIDGKDKVNIYVKKDNDKIVHLLLLASEDDEEIMLSLKGLFSMKDLVEMGKDSNNHGTFHHLSHLKDLENKQ